MITKKRGAGAGTQTRAESETQKEHKPSMANLQGCISDYAEEQIRHEAKMNGLRNRWPVPEPDRERMKDAAKDLIRALHREQKRHYLFAMDILGRFRRRETAEHCARIVFERGLFCWFFMDEKGHWFMRWESGEWLPAKQGQVKAAMQLFGISIRKAKSNNLLSEFDCARLWFDMNRIELTPAVRKSLLTGERLDAYEIRFRCSQEYVESVKGMEAMYREFGTGEKGWF